MEASQAEKNTFGHDVKIHPVTKLPLENGVGSLPEDQQVLLHLAAIEAEQGEEVADKMRIELGIPTAAQIKAKAEADAKAKAAAEQAKFDAAVDKRAKELLAEAEAKKIIQAT